MEERIILTKSEQAAAAVTMAKEYKDYYNWLEWLASKSDEAESVTPAYVEATWRKYLTEKRPLIQRMLKLTGGKSLYIETASAPTCYAEKNANAGPVDASSILRSIAEDRRGIFGASRKAVYSTIDSLAKSLTAGELAAGTPNKNRRLYLELADGTTTTVVVNAGQRIGRAYRQRILKLTENNAQEADRYDQAISRLVEAGKITLKPTAVRLSVSAVDILMASECTNGWSSCHAHSGIHAAGPLSYCQDSSTLIAYAGNRAGTLDQLPGRELLVKVWRAMVFADLEHITGIVSRQYKETVEQYGRATAENLKRFLEINGKCRIIAGANVNTIAKWTYISGSAYEDYKTLGVKSMFCRTKAEMEIAGTAICVCCGLENFNKNSIICGNCDEAITCSCCGMRKRYQATTIDGKVCLDCLQRFYKACSDCGRIHRSQDMHRIAKDSSSHYCAHCYERRTKLCANCGNSEADCEHSESGRFAGLPLCNHCKAEIRHCLACGHGYHIRHYKAFSTGVFGYCRYCVTTHTADCSACGRTRRTSDLNRAGLCSDCAEHFAPCRECGQDIDTRQATPESRQGLCYDCYTKQMANLQF